MATAGNAGAERPARTARRKAYPSSPGSRMSLTSTSGRTAARCRRASLADVARITRAPRSSRTARRPSRTSRSSSTTRIRTPSRRASSASPSTPAPAGSAGSVSVTVVPSPSPALSTTTEPPWRWSSSWTIARPSPRPRVFRELTSSPCRNGSKTCGRNARDIPRPVSHTVTRASSPTCSSRTSTRPSSGVNLIALPSTFASTCWSRVSSPLTRTSVSMPAVSAMPAATASGRIASTAACTTAARCVGPIVSPSRPLMIRETSSRSSISAAWILPLRSTVSRARAARPGDSRPWRRTLIQPSIAASGVRSSCDTTERNSSFARFAASASARAACALPSRRSRYASFSFRSVMSRVIFAAPTIAPVESRIGETEMETLIRRPSFRRRTVSKCSMRSPRRSVATIVSSSFRRSGGRSIAIGRPIASSAVEPNIRSAAAFQLTIVAFRSVLTIASSAESTIAASIACTPTGSDPNGDTEVFRADRIVRGVSRRTESEYGAPGDRVRPERQRARNRPIRRDGGAAGAKKVLLRRRPAAASHRRDAGTCVALPGGTMPRSWVAPYRKEHAELLVARLRWCAGLAFAGGVSLGLESTLFAGPMMRSHLGVACAYAAVSASTWLATYWRPAGDRAVGLALVFLVTLIVLMARDYSPNDPDLAPTGFVALMVGVMVLLPLGPWAQAFTGVTTLAAYAWTSAHSTGPTNLAAATLVVAMAVVSVAAAELIKRHRVRLFERTWQQERLVSLARELAQEVEPDRVIAKVIEHGLALVPVNEITLSLRDAARGTYKVAASAGPDSKHGLALVGTEFPEDFPLARRIVDEHVVEIDDDDPAIGAFLREHGVRRVLYVVLRQAGEMVGIAAFVRHEATSFSDGERLLARGLADQAALALRTAQLVADLTRANHLKSEFVSTMSHELRTPLNVITGYTELMAEGTFGPLTPDLADTLARVRRSAGELLDLVNATLDLGRLEAGRDAVTLETFDLHRLSTDLRLELEPLASPGVSLQFHVMPSAHAVVSDRVKLKTILKNLLANALKFTRRGSVEFHAAADDGVLVMAVRDTGIGISSTDLPLIFEKFRQLDGSSTRRFGGVGLGLHIVKCLVVKLGGTIDVDSAPGAGSEFTVRLPIVDASPLHAAA